MRNYHIEKEIKIKVENPKQLISLLTKLKAEKRNEGSQITTRMDSPELKLEKKGIFLRVRTGEKNIVTLKKKIKSNGDLFERMELETEVKNPELLADIFAELGFTKRSIMEKYRINYSYQNTKISIDELPFGIYIEIEGNPKDIVRTAKELSLDLSKKITVTYWDLFEKYKRKTKKAGENIVFPQNYQPTISSIKSR